MRVTDWTRETLAYRREVRKMEAAGYRLAELDWRLDRGEFWRRRVVDVKLCVNGKDVWYLIGPEPP